VALCKCNSGAKSAAELFKDSKDLESLVVCNEEKIFVGGCRYFVSDVINSGLLVGPLHLALGPKR